MWIKIIKKNKLKVVRIIKKHETQKTNENYLSNDDKVFVPEEFANAQKATGDNIGVKNYNINSFPKFVRIAGYLFIGLLCLFVLLSILLILFF
ncbi:hypothetical protein CWS01_02510 [Niallia nealsonii]|uniref:Uncharacterized protein n=1 Tax=Niallia nealsonii TaxID=115979 RepID=A0A2N0Z6X8_9BACI|nr:hypothetical protein CWS01_02510 [Niallia nealsonii]